MLSIAVSRLRSSCYESTSNAPGPPLQAELSIASPCKTSPMSIAPTFDFLQREPPYSKGELDRLGQYFAGRRESPPENSTEILQWHAALTERSETAIARWIQSHPELAGETTGLVSSSRVKSASTITPKVKDRKIQLSRIQDFSGTRFSWNCLHGNLLSTAEGLAIHLTSTGIPAEVKNYLANPQQGYRAIHIWIQAPAGRLEVQLRTVLQSAWANAFEKAADITGRRIRYESDFRPADKGLNEIVTELLQLSDSIYELERQIESNLREEAELLQRLSNQPRMVSFSERPHQKMSEVYYHLARSEYAKALQASHNRDLQASLVRLAQTLTHYDKSLSTEGGENHHG